MIHYYCSVGSVFLGLDLSNSPYCGVLVVLVHVVLASAITLAILSRFVRWSEKNEAQKELIRKIGVGVEKFFQELSPLINASSRESRYFRYKRAYEILELIYTELFPHANMILKNTSIPGLIDDLHGQFGKFWGIAEELYGAYDDKNGYIRGRVPVPPKITERIHDLEKSINDTIKKINSLIVQLDKLCKELT
jgi:hypothetical protein